MAKRRSGTFDVRAQAAYAPADPVAHNDVEPLVIREITAPLSLRARLALQPAAATPAPKRVVAR